MKLSYFASLSRCNPSSASELLSSNFAIFRFEYQPNRYIYSVFDVFRNRDLSICRRYSCYGGPALWVFTSLSDLTSAFPNYVFIY